MLLCYYVIMKFLWDSSSVGEKKKKSVFDSGRWLGLELVFFFVCLQPLCDHLVPVHHI
jgi:hypothetical protein